MSGWLTAPGPPLAGTHVFGVCAHPTLWAFGDPGKIRSVILVPPLLLPQWATVDVYAGCSLPQPSPDSSVQAVLPGAGLCHLQEGDHSLICTRHLMS